MRDLTFCFLVAALTLGIEAAPALAQSSTCTACHSRSAGLLPPIHQTLEWAASGHATPAVGCESCHGGDAASTRPGEAHRGVWPASSARSQVNEVNQPVTCVVCHRATTVAVSRTIHQILAEAGDVRTPTCVTCHGVNVSQMPTPADMERRCASCHRPGSPRAAYPAAARELLDAIASLRADVAALSAEIATISDSPRRTKLALRLFEAQAALKTASVAFHEFRPAPMTATLDNIRHRRSDLADPHDFDDR